jgi:hypothetical protein
LYISYLDSSFTWVCHTHTYTYTHTRAWTIVPSLFWLFLWPLLLLFRLTLVGFVHTYYLFQPRVRHQPKRALLSNKRYLFKFLFHLTRMETFAGRVYICEIPNFNWIIHNQQTDTSYTQVSND